jgi:hypothetical protein
LDSAAVLPPDPPSRPQVCGRSDLLALMFSNCRCLGWSRTYQVFHVVTFVRATDHRNARGQRRHIVFKMGGTQVTEERNLMKKLAIIGTTLIGSMMLCTVPLSLHYSQATVVSVALDTADARVGRPGTPGSVAGVARRSARRCAAGVTC